MESRKAPPDFDDEFLRAVGRVTLEFARLEKGAWVALSILFDNPVFSAHLATQLPFSKLSDLIDAIFQVVRDLTLRSKMSETIKRIAELEQKRNAIVHSFWLPGELPNTAERIKDRIERGKGLQTKYETHSSTDLNELANDISQAAAEFILLAGQAKVASLEK